MRKFLRMLAISGLLYATVCLPVLAESRQMREGIASFKRGDYKDAVEWLKAAAAGEESRSAEAHYYLANALHREGKLEEALAEYRACLNLKPDPAMELYCLRALEHYELNATRKRHVQYKQVQRQAEKKEEKVKIIEPSVDLTRLPPVRKARTYGSGVGYATVIAWNLYQRADYLSQASAELENASNDFDDAERDKKSAGSMVHSLVPRFRAYGESEDEFMVRYNKAKDRVASIVEPYREAAQRQQERLNEAQQVYDLCAQASRQVGPFRPYYPQYYPGYPYYPRNPQILPYPRYR